MSRNRTGNVTWVVAPVDYQKVFSTRTDTPVDNRVYRKHKKARDRQLAPDGPAKPTMKEVMMSRTTHYPQPMDRGWYTVFGLAGVSAVIMVAVIAALIGLASTLLAPAPVAASEPPRIPPHINVTPVPLPVTFASEGDSISALRDNNNVPITWSWVRDAVAEGNLTYVGVYMRAGAATPELLAHAKPTAAKVMVVMAGTNDVSQHLSISSTLNRIAAIFGRTGGRVKILSAVAPRNTLTAETNQLNYWLQQLAAQHHWVFIDPWTSVRAANGTWVPGANADVIHPSAATGVIVGQVLRQTMLAYAG